MSNRYTTLIQLELRPSPLLIAFVLVAVLGATFILLFLPLELLWRGLGLVGVAMLGAKALVSIYGRRAINALKLDQQGVCTLSRNDGSWQRMRPLRATVRYRWVMLTLVPLETHGVEHVLILFDAASAESFRRFRASLNQWDWQA